MPILIKLLIFIILPFSLLSQEKLDPFQIYGPYGTNVYENYTQALLNAESCYRLKIYNQDLSKTVKKLKKLKKLYVIEFKNNNIDSLPEEISSFNNLMYLKSSGNSLKKLPNSFGLSPTIKSLVLHHTQLDSLPNNFNQLESLMELEIQINDAEIFDLKNTLSGLYNLKTLMIYKNNLKSFPSGLDKNTKLKKVLIVNSGLTEIDSSFGKMKNIQTLILDENKFKKFPKEIFELKTLKELSLRENQLTSLPEDIIRIKGSPSLSSLRQYSISGRSSTVPSSIPNLFVKDPVAIFLTTNSIGIISTNFTSCSLIFNLFTK